MDQLDDEDGRTDQVPDDEPQLQARGLEHAASLLGRRLVGVPSFAWYFFRIIFEYVHADFKATR